MGLRIESTLSDRLEDLIYRVIGISIEVHRHLGPGFIESIYERALYHELDLNGISYEHQKEILVPYKGIALPGQRFDLVIDRMLIVELKAIDQVLPIHEAQLLSYLKSLNMRAGLIINFNVQRLKDGIKRIVL